MRFKHRMLWGLFFTGLVPVSLLGLLSFRSNRAELVSIVGRHQAQSAHETARVCEEFVLRVAQSLRTAVDYLPLERLDRDQLAQVLKIPYRQLGAVRVLAVLDQRGDAVSAPVYQDRPAGSVGSTREEVTPADLEAFAHHVPLAQALASGIATGPPYLSARGQARIAIAVRVDTQPPRALVAEISLAELQPRFDERGAAGNAAYLVDPAGKVLLGGGPGGPGDDERLLIAEGLRTHQPLLRTVERASAGGWLAAFAPVESLGWGVVIAEPTAVAFRAADRVRAYTVFWVAFALVMIALLGAVLTRSLTRPIAELSAGVQALEQGAFEKPVPVRGRDEFAEFARGFNRMAAQIKHRDEEIRQWNQELQKRVDQQTRELKDAQDQILRARKLAALGSLNAGLAHELNNPLTGIMGLVSILRRELGEKSPQGEMLGMVLEQARRIAAVVAQVRQVVEQERGRDPQKFPFANPIKAALAQLRGALEAGKVGVELQLDPGMPDVEGDPSQLQQVVASLIQNAITAMPDGGKLTVHLSAVRGEALKLTVGDTGRGIPDKIRERIFDPFFTTKADPRQVGLGLTLAYNIVTAHHGQLSVESEVGRGSVFTVLLPAAGEQAHLY